MEGVVVWKGGIQYRDIIARAAPSCRLLHMR